METAVKIIVSYILIYTFLGSWWKVKKKSIILIFYVYSLKYTLILSCLLRASVPLKHSEQNPIQLFSLNTNRNSNATTKYAFILELGKRSYYESLTASRYVRAWQSYRLILDYATTEMLISYTYKCTNYIKFNADYNFWWILNFCGWATMNFPLYFI